MRYSPLPRQNTQTILQNPITDAYSILMEDDKVRVGASSMQGWRSTMEDAHTIYLTLPHFPDKMSETEGAIAAVFDGHCGGKMAQIAAAFMRDWITSTQAFAEGNYERALTEAFLSGDAFLQRTMPTEQSGCTCNCTILVQNHLYCANIGDSRAVLCRGGQAIPLSEDHKPTQPQEKSRIVRSGGYVHAGRVNGVLSLSRAFGDFAFKDAALKPEDQTITALPDVRHVELTSQDEFVLMACDGVWDMMTTEQAVEFVRNDLATHSDLTLACERLMNACLSPVPNALGTDNFTVIILQFKSAFLQKIGQELEQEGVESAEAPSPSTAEAPQHQGDSAPQKAGA